MPHVAIRVARSLALPAVAGVLCLSLPGRPAEARPQYLETFQKTYEPLKESAEEKKCTICHGMGKKTERNKYGQAIVAGLGEEKNVKDAEAVEKALRAAEKKDSAVEGKTFGDLIKEGKLPE